jgi:hypothetical protein
MESEIQTNRYLRHVDEKLEKIVLLVEKINSSLDKIYSIYEKVTTPFYNISDKFYQIYGYPKKVSNIDDQD